MSEQPQAGDQAAPRITEIEKLLEAVLALVTINQQLCKKLESNETKLAALARYVGTNEQPVCGVI